MNKSMLFIAYEAMQDSLNMKNVSHLFHGHSFQMCYMIMATSHCVEAGMQATWNRWKYEMPCIEED
jgi:hypothetical protein